MSRGDESGRVKKVIPERERGRETHVKRRTLRAGWLRAGFFEIAVSGELGAGALSALMLIVGVISTTEAKPICLRFKLTLVPCGRFPGEAIQTHLNGYRQGDMGRPGGGRG